MILSLLICANIFAQEKEKIKTDFRFFNWSSLSYTFGLDGGALNEKLNSLADLGNSSLSGFASRFHKISLALVESKNKRKKAIRKYFQ